MPISIIMNLFIINLGMYYFNDLKFPSTSMIIYNNIFWLLIAYFTKIYKFNRYTKVPKIISQLFFQYSIFALASISYFAIYDQLLNAKHQILFLVCTFLVITTFRTIYFYGLRRYRVSGHNFRNVIVVGANQGAYSLIDFFNKRLDFGYHYKGYFSDKKINKPNYLGEIKDCFDYVLNNDISEIYCSISTLSKKQINEFINFGDDYVRVVKLIPDSKDLFSKMKLEYYGFIPVLSIRKLPFDDVIIRRSKRVFDILFSLLIIIFVLSWLIPILFVLVKTESKGPLFFKQVREGIKGIPFNCYKFRSMDVNSLSDEIQTVKDDPRITKVGAFIRKTSIDELPQFINVLKGDMSVVGPRPHMLSQSEIFKKIVSKYMVRHFVKPGVTGLAQVKGFRGEIEKDSDIKNRVKFDIFYIENWSFFLDFKIIVFTFLNLFKGEDKAY
jgi:putative colanic acid biosynthesis UDP-glucose lipid carrier transferase